MEQNFFDEMFEKLNILESENKLLKEELENINEDNEINIENFMTENPNEKLNEVKEFQNKIKIEFFSSNSNTYNNFTDMTINFKPYDELNSMDITGDFTNWQKIPMEKIEDHFIYKCKVLKGYCYKYCFYYQENKQIDYNEETFDDGTTMGINNIKRIPDETLPNKFHDQINISSAELHKLIENQNTIKMTYEQEKNFFVRILEFAKMFNTIKLELNKNKKESEEKGRNHYEVLLKICDKFEKEKFEDFTNHFLNKIITHNDQNYLILNINFAESYFKCIKLYDKNGIKIDINHNTNLSNGNSFAFDKLYDNCIIHNKEESNQILEDYKKDDYNVLRIYYELFSCKKQENEEQRSQPNNEAKEIVPYKIQPENIDLNNYKIVIVDNQIVNIESKTDENLLICYLAKLIKEESSDKFKGLVSNSVLKVYTSIYNKDIVNIIHIHLNDTSEEISVDSLFLEKSEMVNDHKNFQLDAQGKKLNYKFLFRDFQLIKIFYNISDDFIDEPIFEEIRINEDEIVKINYSKTDYNGFYGKVKSIPMGMLARKDKKDIQDSNQLQRKKSIEPTLQGDCEERHLEDLIGYVDVTIIFLPDMSVMENPIVIKIPVCQLVSLSFKEQIPFETLLAKQSFMKKKSVFEKIRNYHEKIMKLLESVQDEKKINEISIEETREYLNKFEETNLQEELELDKLDENEDLSYFEKVNAINEGIPEIVKRLQIHLRNYIFSQKKK